MVRFHLKKNLASAMLMVVILFISACDKPEGPSTTTIETTIETIETTTESVTVFVQPVIYYEDSSDTENLIALLELTASEFPKPFGSSEWQKESYENSIFYEVLIVTPEKKETHVAFISIFKPSRVEDVYKALDIRYEDGYAIYKFDKYYHVVDLNSEPTVYKTPVPFYETYGQKQTDSPETLYLAGTGNSEIIFNTIKKQFEDGGDDVFKFWSDPYDWSSKTINHMPANPEVVHITEDLTDDPDLLKISLGESTSQLFNTLGPPISKGWILGDYFAYEHMMIYTMIDEKSKQLNLYPITRINYYGESAVGGIKIGMTIREVEKIIGPLNQLIFTDGAENFYPLTIHHVVGNFLLQIDFNTNIEVNDISISLFSDDVNAGSPEPLNEYFQSILDASKTTAEALIKDGALMSHVDVVSYAHDTYNAVYFTIENESSRVSNVGIGLYRYDMTTKAPIRLTEQPLAIVFEIAGELNPSVIALGLDDGILYKIDLNRLILTSLSGPNYQAHIPIYGNLIKKQE